MRAGKGVLPQNQNTVPKSVFLNTQWHLTRWYWDRKKLKCDCALKLDSGNITTIKH